MTTIVKVYRLLGHGMCFTMCFLGPVTKMVFSSKKRYLLKMCIFQTNIVSIIHYSAKTHILWGYLYRMNIWHNLGWIVKPHCIRVTFYNTIAVFVYHILVTLPNNGLLGIWIIWWVFESESADKVFAHWFSPNDAKQILETNLHRWNSGMDK